MTPSPPGVLWTSDDGPILGLAIDRDRIFCVTAGKLLSIARDGSDTRVLAQSSTPFAYSGAIATNGVAVYWAVSSPSANVSMIPRDGGGFTSIGAEGYATVGIALDEARVYWLTNDAVMSVPLTGGGTSTRLATLQGASYENAFTLIGGMLYWSTNFSAAGVFRMPAVGGMPSVIAPGPVFSLEPYGTAGVAWLEDPTPVLVQTAPDASTSQRIPLSGWIDEFATDGARWYWRDEKSGVVNVLAVVNAPATALTQPVANATANIGDGRHILVDQRLLIWADRTAPTASQPDTSVLRALTLAQ